MSGTVERRVRTWAATLVALTGAATMRANADTICGRAMPVMAQDADVDPNYAGPEVGPVSRSSWTFGTGPCPGGVSGRRKIWKGF